MTPPALLPFCLLGNIRPRPQATVGLRTEEEPRSSFLVGRQLGQARDRPCQSATLNFNSIAWLVAPACGWVVGRCLARGR